MQSASPSPSAASPAGLPPVNPPTGKFIMQLFLVPGLIVGLIICLLLLVNWMFSGPRSPEAFLSKLDDNNPEVRWRSASDLAQVLLRDPQLASNADFCLKLSERLDRAVRDSEPAEKAFLERLPKLSDAEAEKERRQLEQERNYIKYLTAALGNFTVPTGSAVLCQLVEQEPSLERSALNSRRRKALWALTNLGERLREFDRLPAQGRAVEQERILDQLRKLDETLQDRPKTWNHEALVCLEKRKAGQWTTMGVDQALLKAAQAEDSFTRELAAFALGVWKGDAAQDRRMEEALVRLTSDDGRGLDRTEEPPDPESARTREVFSRPGMLVQLNATRSLLRRGSSKVRAGMVKEMLNEKLLGEDMQVENQKGQREPNRSLAAMTVVETLKALAEYYRQKPADSLPGVAERVRELTSSSNPAIAMAARQVVQELTREG